MRVDIWRPAEDLLVVLGHRGLEELIEGVLGQGLSFQRLALLGDGILADIRIAAEELPKEALGVRGSKRRCLLGGGTRPFGRLPFDLTRT